MNSNKAITVNGRTEQVLNSLSCGPGQEAIEYQLKGCYVYRIGDTWKLQRPGQFAVVVTVTR